MKVTASDGSTTVSDEFDITVSAADNTAPTVTSIERQDPTALLTNSDTPTWRVTFSEAVKNVGRYGLRDHRHDRNTDGHARHFGAGRL